MSLGDIFGLKGVLVGGGSGGSSVTRATANSLQNKLGSGRLNAPPGSYTESYREYMHRVEFERQKAMMQNQVAQQHAIKMDTVVTSEDMVDAPSAMDMSLAELMMLWRQRFGDSKWVPLGEARADSFWRVATTRMVNAHLLERLEVSQTPLDHSRLYRLRGDDADR